MGEVTKVFLSESHYTLRPHLSLNKLTLIDRGVRAPTFEYIELTTSESNKDVFLVQSLGRIQIASHNPNLDVMRSLLTSLLHNDNVVFYDNEYTLIWNPRLAQCSGWRMGDVGAVDEVSRDN